MPILNCGVHNCSYNKENNCCIAAIEIGEPGATHAKNTCCKNFVSTEYTNSNQVHHSCDMVDIRCEAAGCIHNANHLCKAPKVQVGGSTTACCIEDTDCLSFTCK